jgi:hypothetical protein
MFSVTLQAVRVPSWRSGSGQDMPPSCIGRWSILIRLFCVLALVALNLLFVLPVTTWAAPQPHTRSTPSKTPAYRLAIFPWNLLDGAYLYTDTISSALSEVINETGLFDIKFSYYRDKDSHPEIVQKLEQNIKNIWRRKSWFSVTKPHITSIVDLAKDLGVDAVLLYHAQIVFGLEAQDTLRAFLINVHDRKIYEVTGYTGDFARGEGFREIKKMTHDIFASFKLDNPPDMVIVQQKQQDQAQKAEEARLAELKRREEERKRQEEELSRTPASIQISGQVIGQSTEGGLGGVAWSLNVDEALTSGTTDADGSFNINLSKLEGWPAQKHVVVRFSKKGFEQVSWVLNVHAAGNPTCRPRTISMRPNRVEDLTPDPEAIETLDSYYSSDGRSLYLLLSPSLMRVIGNDPSLMLEAFQENITDHLQTLPVVPPPQDITVPPDVSLEWIQNLEIGPQEARKMQAYVSYLKALAMLKGIVVPSVSEKSEVCVRFDYQLIPFQEELGFVREIASYAWPVGQLSFEHYEELAQRLGFYTLLALCLREVLAFDRSQSAGELSGLERARAYLVAEQSRLGPDEPLKTHYVRTLLDIISAKLGAGKGFSLLQQQLQQQLRAPGGKR